LAGLFSLQDSHGNVNRFLRAVLTRVDRTNVDELVRVELRPA
jgi:hypothetical protein